MPFFLDSHDKFDSTFSTTKAGISVTAKTCELKHDKFSAKPTIVVKEKAGKVSAETTVDLPKDTSIKYDGKEVTLTAKAKVDATKVTLTAVTDKCGKNFFGTAAVTASPISTVSTKVKGTFLKGGETVKVVHQHMAMVTDDISVSAGFQHTTSTHTFLGVVAAYQKNSLQAELSVNNKKTVTASLVSDVTLFDEKFTAGLKATPSADFKGVASYAVGVAKGCDGGKFTAALENCKKVRLGFKNKNKVAFGYTCDFSGGCSELNHAIGVKVTL